MNKTLTAALIASTALLAPAAVANAATVSLENGAIVYRGEGSEGLSLIVTTYEDWDTGETLLALQDSGADRQVVTSGPCSHNDIAGAIVCPLNPSQPLRVEGSAGNDWLSVFSSEVPDAKPITINGGAGNDTIKDAYNGGAGRTFTGGPGRDDIKGYAGNDAIDGGDGDDVVDGGAGNDKVRGGAGNDEMWGDHYDEPGADLMDGGPGVDTTEDWTTPEDLDQQPPVAVTLDGVANDGRPGEGDNVIGIERLNMYVVGSFTGSEGADRIVLVNPGNDGPSRLIGRGGDDELIGNDFDDVVDGGAGNDHVEGGHGNDTVTGGPGRDVIYGDATAAYCGWYSCKIPFGNDVIYARDGEPDSIDCGIGTDKAIVDPIDTVANCETVQGSGGGGDQPSGKVAVALAGKRSLRSLASKGLRLKVACPTACSVDGTMRLRGKKVGGGHATGSGTVTAKLKVTRKAKRQLKRLRKATLSVRVTVQLTSGPAQTSTKKIKLGR